MIEYAVYSFETQHFSLHGTSINSNIVLFRLKTKHLNGETLLFLKKMKVEAPEAYYQCLYNELDLKNLQAKMIFTKALDQLK